MENTEFKKAEIFSFNREISYTDGAIVSKLIVKKTSGNVTLFSFDKGQSLSEHTASFDALIQVIDGNAEVIINKTSYVLNAGESIIMPANIPHAVKAPEKFKMILTMIKSS